MGDITELSKSFQLQSKTENNTILKKNYNC